MLPLRGTKLIFPELYSLTVSTKRWFSDIYTTHTHLTPMHVGVETTAGSSSGAEGLTSGIRPTHQHVKNVLPTCHFTCSGCDLCIWRHFLFHFAARVLSSDFLSLFLSLQCPALIRLACVLLTTPSSSSFASWTRNTVCLCLCVWILLFARVRCVWADYPVLTHACLINLAPINTPSRTTSVSGTSRDTTTLLHTTKM